eukprot:5131079-Alexandrium_andersonii.AAC.1
MTVCGVAPEMAEITEERFQLGPSTRACSGFVFRPTRLMSLLLQRSSSTKSTSASMNDDGT